MSRTNSTTGGGDAIARHVRALPSAPSLEYERKEAKALLRLIRAGDNDALRRVHLAHPVFRRDRPPRELRLADAQHVIAREYGFASWPRLVEYFELMERHRRAPRHNSSDDGMEAFERHAKSIVQRHERKDPIVARELAAFVPRFFARPITEIVATPITDDEARLVVARQRRRVSWDELVERASASRAWMSRTVWDREHTPFARARAAMRAHDLDALGTILDEEPELLAPPLVEREWRQTLASLALTLECTERTAGARGVTDLLASRGVDVQQELNARLLGWPHDEAQPERVRWYLERGADPHWMPPNGISVLEHAIVRYKNGACVDLITALVTPPKALWVAAGLGDVDGVRHFLNGKGRLMPEGRLHRPDPMAMGWFAALPPNREADDLEIMWEAFEIAGWNGRWAAMDALLNAGLPVDHAPLGAPLVIEAVGNVLVPLAKYLVSRGADLDREWPAPANGSARVLAQSHIRNDPQNDNARRLVAICGGGTPEAILGAMDTSRVPPVPEKRTIRAMQLAADDAARQGQTVVTTENMLVGLLRVHDGIFAEFVSRAGTHMPTLRATIGARLLKDIDPLVGGDLPLDAMAEAAVRAATLEANERRRDYVQPAHVLLGILSQPNGPGASILSQAGTNATTLWEQLASAC